MSYTYNSFQQALAIEIIYPNAAVSTGYLTDPNFQGILPTIIDEAEQRCYRELDLLYATSVQTLPTVAGNRIFDISAANPYIIAIERLRLFTPAGSDVTNSTGQNPLFPMSVDVIDAIFSGAAQGPPQYFGMQSDTIVVVGPTPDDEYNIEISGDFRPVPLYNAAPQDGTQTTFLTKVLPDLFLAAAMVSASGYRHNFGAQSDDPRMAISWEGRYQANLVSAKSEETRKKFLGWGLVSSSPTPQPAS